MFSKFSEGYCGPVWDGTSRDVKVQSFCVGPVVCVLMWVFLAACARRRGVGGVSYKDTYIWSVG